MPRAEGAVTFTALGTTGGSALAGAVADLRLQEVDIASDFATTPVPNGRVLNLAAWSFDVALDAR